MCILSPHHLINMSTPFVNGRISLNYCKYYILFKNININY